MSRQPGFARGDFDTSFPLDDKFLELRGSLDPLHYYAAAGVYWHVLAAGWREADRKPGSRTTPDAEDLLAELKRVGLLDKEGRLKVASFRRWVGKALASRKADADRKARNRTGMSRVTPAESGGVTPLSNARARQGHAGRTGESLGGPGGSMDHTTGAIEAAWSDATGVTLLSSGEFAIGIVDDSARRHPEAAVVAAIRETRQGFEHIPETRAMAAALRGHLDPIQRGGRKPAAGGHTRTAAEVEGAFRG
jgi:hypothetical protein